MSCLQVLNKWDNLPLIGYLRTRGRCRNCGIGFSSRYFWVELAVGLIFVGIYWIEIQMQAFNGPDFFYPWHLTPGLRHSYFSYTNPTPPIATWIYFAAHAALAALLLAATIVDWDYRIIPTQVTYFGTVLGIVISVLMPWPWPSGGEGVPRIANAPSWAYGAYSNLIPTGVALWPVWTPPSWAPAGSWQLGLMTSLAGAAAGMFIIRALKFAFEFGFGQEAVGLGDADLLMMAGAFLGWQPIVLAVPFGALLTLAVLPLVFLWSWWKKKPFDPALPFGPGLAAGVVVAWFGWPILGEYGRSFFFDPTTLVFVGVGGYAALLVAGLMLRRGPNELEPPPSS
ncbi:MAG: prepilin peptidase, partial [Gemmataceae bacterium]